MYSSPGRENSQWSPYRQRLEVDPLKPRSPSRSNVNSPVSSKSPSKSGPKSYAPQGQLQNFGLDDAEDVTGMMGRLKLQKNESASGARNWMDSQRKNIRAYEYLCHVGEAKQWIEACIGETIPPAVELEEALRDGVILAKLTRVFAPHLVKRIFEHPKLQYRHTENINYFFRFLDELGVPDSFAFELIDLYEKKNLPQIIYTIHAVSYILAGENLAPSIEDLVGKLEFTDDEIHNAQRGLDSSGISLPNFSKFGGGSQKQEPQVDEKTLVEFQSIARGYLLRMQAKYLRKVLATSSISLINLQSIYRGAYIREKCKCLRHELDCVLEVESLQALIRGNLLRKSLKTTRNEVSKNSWVSLFQAQVRGYLMRRRTKSLKDSMLRVDVVPLQSLIRGALLRDRQTEAVGTLAISSSRVKSLQSIVRGAQLRNRLTRDAQKLHIFSPQIVALQSKFRGLSLRFDYQLLMEELEDETPSVMEFQSVIRGAMVRKKFEERMTHFRNNLDKVIKIQSFVRAKKQGDAYKSLTMGSNPPVGTIKNFIHLLNDSELDFEEEMVLEQKRKKMMDEVKNNEQLEQFVSQLDVKIALLLKNKITLDELIRHRNKGIKGLGGGLGSVDTSAVQSGASDPFDLKALNKASRRRLELYQGLFYILQSQPVYFARLFKKLGKDLISERNIKELEGLVLTVFAYGQGRRESFLLLQLISRSITEEVNSCDSARSFMKSSCFFWRLLGAVSRSAKCRSSLKELLGPTTQSLLNTDLDLESNPLTIYRTLLNNEELATGRPSSRDPNVPIDEAIQDPETRKTFVENLKNLREYSSQFLQAIESNTDAVPYHVRFAAREIYESGRRRFKNESEDRILALAGQTIFKTYIIPGLIGADHFGIVDMTLDPVQSKNLSEVGKILSQIASLRPFSKDNVYLQPLNDFILNIIPRTRTMLKNLIMVPDLEQQFHTSVFDDITSHQKPTLYIKASDIFAVHSLVCKELGTLSLQDTDSLRTVITELGNLPNDASEILNIARFREVKLELNPSFCKVEDPEAESKMLFVAVKRCVIYILRVQSGGTLVDIMLAPVLAEHEQKYQAILKEEEISRRKKANEFKDSADVVVNFTGDLSQMSYRELKGIALEKILELEAYGKISRDNSYQDILNSIAMDIRMKKDRRDIRSREMHSIDGTLTSLEEKEAYLQTLLKTYNDYIEQAMTTLQSKKGKKKSIILPFSKQYFHLRDLQKSGRVPKFGSYKYSAANLYEKGVLVELNGYPEKKYHSVMLTFSSDQVGIFTVEASYGSIVLPGATVELSLDDLLQKQYNSQQYLKIFDDMITLNTNLTLHFIFKKFYGEN